MNFYGHAHYASILEAEPGYVLGSMLPDFEGMCGTPLEGVDDEPIARGIALHHATDELFHRAPPFLSLCAEGLASLTERGVPRAAARACAHVGAELVLDGILLAEHGPNAAYERALHAGAVEARGPNLRFRDGGARFESLRSRLLVFGVPHRYGDPEFVADRLYDALAKRPRLALARELVPTVADWLREATPRIRDAKGELDRIVSSGLGITG